MMVEAIRKQLTDCGMSDAEAAAKQALFEHSIRLLRDLCASSEERLRAFFVPGRIEVFGKHTDYAGGRSLLYLRFSLLGLLDPQHQLCPEVRA